MKFFRNRWVALFLAAAVVAGTALLNTRIMLDRERRQLEASFFQSETDMLTPYYYINSRIGTAAALAAIGDLYPDLAEETQALRDARRALVYAADAKDLSAMYDANGDLTAAGDAFAGPPGSWSWTLGMRRRWTITTTPSRAPSGSWTGLPTTRRCKPFCALSTTGFPARFLPG